MKNTTKIKVAKKYEPFIETIEKDSDGYWAYTIKGYQFAGMGGSCHTAHEDNQNDLLGMIRTIELCHCDGCKEALFDICLKEAWALYDSDKQFMPEVDNLEEDTIDAIMFKVSHEFDLWEEEEITVPKEHILKAVRFMKKWREFVDEDHKKLYAIEG